MIDLKIELLGDKKISRGFREMSAGIPGAVEEAGSDAASMIVKVARGNIPSRSGRARGSIKASGSSVTGGGASAPYYPWLDFGGAVGINDSVRRPFLKTGRGIWRAYVNRKVAILKTFEDSMDRLIKQSGLD